MESSAKSVGDLITTFQACRGEVRAKNAETGTEAKVVEIKNLVPPNRGGVHFTVALENGKVHEFRANYTHSGSLGSYLYIEIDKPAAPGTEATEIRILDGGREDYPVYAHGSGSSPPTLALTLTNVGAAERNKPLVEAYELEQKREREERERQKQEKRDAKAAAYKAEKDEQARQHREGVAALLERLRGKTIEHLTLENGVLTLMVDGAPVVTVTVNSADRHRPIIDIECGDCHLSSYRKML